MEVQLRAVERAVALVDNVALAHLGDGFLQRLLRELPILLVAHMIVGHGGQLYLIGQAEEGVDLVEEADDVLYLVLHLIPGHKDMRVVLSEAADAEQAVQRTGQLMAVHQTQLTHAQRQVTVGVRLRLIHQHSAGAVHGLYRVILAVDDGGVHVLFVVIPVTGGLPEVAVEYHRGRDLDVAVSLVHLAPVVDKGIFEHHALGQEEREAGSLLGQHKQAQLLAETAMVAALCLLKTLKICVQLVLLREGYAVYALERLTAGVAAPVGGVAGGELDGVALDAAGGVKVRTGAEIYELALTVEGDVRILGQIVYKLDLIRLLALLHELDGLLAGQLKALKLQLLLADLAHLGLDLLHYFRSKGEGRVHIIIEAVFNGGADCQLDLRVEALHGLCQHMGTGVPISAAVFFIFKAVFVLVHNVLLN